MLSKVSLQSCLRERERESWEPGATQKNPLLPPYLSLPFSYWFPSLLNWFHRRAIPQAGFLRWFQNCLRPGLHQIHSKTVVSLRGVLIWMRARCLANTHVHPQFCCAAVDGAAPDTGMGSNFTARWMQWPELLVSSVQFFSTPIAVNWEQLCFLMVLPHNQAEFQVKYLLVIALSKGRALSLSLPYLRSPRAGESPLMVEFSFILSACWLLSYQAKLDLAICV